MMPSHAHMACLPGQWEIQTRLKHCPCFQETCKFGKETDTQKITLNTRDQRVIKRRALDRTLEEEAQLQHRFLYWGKKCNQEGDPGHFVLHHLIWLVRCSLGPQPEDLEILVDTVDSLECATSCLLTLICPFVNTYIDSPNCFSFFLAGSQTFIHQ